MSRRCLACGGRRGNHASDCERLAALREASDPQAKHPETPEELADRSRRRQRIRGKNKPIKFQRNAHYTRQTRERHGWTLDANGEFVPQLPEPVGRIPEGVILRLKRGSAGSGVLYVHACPLTGNDRCWFDHCMTPELRCWIVDNHKEHFGQEPTEEEAETLKGRCLMDRENEA